MPMVQLVDHGESWAQSLVNNQEGQAIAQKWMVNSNALVVGGWQGVVDATVVATFVGLWNNAYAQNKLMTHGYGWCIQRCFDQSLVSTGSLLMLSLTNQTSNHQLSILTVPQASASNLAITSKLISHYLLLTTIYNPLQDWLPIMKPLYS